MATKILVGDCLKRLQELPDESVHCVVTSPPYWGLRAYKGDPGMIGLEPTFEEHLSNLVAVFREVRRVLRKDGTVFLNYGDAYTSGGRATYRSGASDNKGHQVQDDMPRPDTPANLKPKDLMMMPARVALALQADGWWIRSEIIWHKPNPMPESCKDRPTSAHEKLYLLSKAARYFYDAEAVQVPALRAGCIAGGDPDRMKGSGAGAHITNTARMRSTPVASHANLRNVWTIPTHSFSQAHFATFPPRLVEPCIKAGTSERGVCKQCGGPWVREVKRGDAVPDAPGYKPRGNWRGPGIGSGMHAAGSDKPMPNHHYERETTGWSPTC